MAADAAPASASASGMGNLPPKQATEAKGQSPSVPETKQGTNPFVGTKHKAVIDGVSEEVSYEDLLAGYQKGKAADKRMDEAAAMQRASQEVMQGLASGDKKAWEWLKKQVPKDVFKQIAFDYAYQQMEHDALPPEKKKEMELGEWEQRLKAEQEARETDSKQKQWASEVDQAGQYIQKQFDEFVERSGKKLSSEEMFRMSEYALAFIKKNNSFPNLDQLYTHVSGLHEREAMGVLQKKAANVQELLKWMPPEVVKALKKAHIDESVSTQPKRHAPDGKERTSTRGEPKKVGIDAAFELLEKRVKRSR